MASYTRALIMFRNTLDPAADVMTNTVYFTQTALTETDYQGYANDLWTIFANHGNFGNGCNELEVRLYSMEDAKPRPIKAQKKAAVTKGEAGVREVSLCLSFKGAGGGPRQKGRIFAGPFPSAALVDRPAASLRTNLLTMATSLANLGGADVDWCVFSPTTYAATQNYGQAFHPVQLAWVDDAWDTQRRRGRIPTARSTLALSE